MKQTTQLLESFITDFTKTAALRQEGQLIWSWLNHSNFTRRPDIDIHGKYVCVQLCKIVNRAMFQTEALRKQNEAGEVMRNVGTCYLVLGYSFGGGQFGFKLLKHLHL